MHFEICKHTFSVRQLFSSIKVVQWGLCLQFGFCGSVNDDSVDVHEQLKVPFHFCKEIMNLSRTSRTAVFLFMISNDSFPNVLFLYTNSEFGISHLQQYCRLR